MNNLLNLNCLIEFDKLKIISHRLIFRWMGKNMVKPSEAKDREFISRRFELG
jgi:hypothetical protein